MRYLAIARFRLLTTLRTATPIFIISMLPPLVAAIALSAPEPLFRYEADGLLGPHATAAMLAWILHAVVLLVACDALGNLRLLRPDLTTTPPDLIDTAPVGQASRFWGEALGILTTTVIVHVCCLPLLVVVAVLSPLTTAMFVQFEAVIIAMMVLASTGAAWKRRARRTKWSATRSARSAVLFLIFFFVALRATTRWETFRDSAWAFTTRPSPRAWKEVGAAVDNPELLFVLVFLLFAGYICFFTISSIRKAESGLENRA